jgi:Rrf2 family protein
MEQNHSVLIPARVDYGIRALLALAGADGIPCKVEHLSDEQGIPTQFLAVIMAELARADLVSGQRGPDGGYRLSRPAEEITMADIIRALDGRLVEVQGRRPEEAHYEGAATHLQLVWIAVRSSLRSVLEGFTLADVLAGDLPMPSGELVPRGEA